MDNGFQPSMIKCPRCSEKLWIRTGELRNNAGHAMQWHRAECLGCFLEGDPGVNINDAVGSAYLKFLSLQSEVQAS